MKMAKLRRKLVALERVVADLEARLVVASRVWREQRAQIRLLTDQRYSESLQSVQDRRADISFLKGLHHKVLRRVPGRTRTERFFCVECNIAYPCRTIEVLDKQSARLDELYKTLQAA